MCSCGGAAKYRPEDSCHAVASCTVRQASQWVRCICKVKMLKSIIRTETTEESFSHKTLKFAASCCQWEKEKMMLSLTFADAVPSAQ